MEKQKMKWFKDRKKTTADENPDGGENKSNDDVSERATVSSGIEDEPQLEDIIAETKRAAGSEDPAGVGADNIENPSAPSDEVQQQLRDMLSEPAQTQEKGSELPEPQEEVKAAEESAEPTPAEAAPVVDLNDSEPKNEENNEAPSEPVTDKSEDLSDKALSENGGAEKPKKTRAEKSKTAKAKKKNSKVKVWIISVVILVMVLAAASVGAGIYVTNLETIFPNIIAEGEPLGNLTKAEAQAKLQTAGWDKNDPMAKITVMLPLDKQIVIPAYKVGASIDSEDIMLAAYNYGHTGDIFSNLITYIKCMMGEKMISAPITPDREAIKTLVEPELDKLILNLTGTGAEIGKRSILVVKGAKSVEIDKEEIINTIATRLQSREYGKFQYEPKVEGTADFNIDDLHETIFVEMVNSHFDIESRKVVPSAVGINFDVEAAKKLWDAASIGATIKIPLIITEPEVTTEEVENSLFRDVLGTNTTTLAGSTTNRITNVKLACAELDGKILYPGESLSFNETVGKRTEQRGYKYAGAYSGGQVVQEIGGGICQVSSTLYYSTLLSNLKIDDRTCHYFGVAYLPPGYDATVSWGRPDFKFTNSRNYPIKISATVDEETKKLTVSIIGTDEDGTYVKITYGTWLVYKNEEFPEVATGYKAATFRNIYDKDDNLISKELEANSEYHYHEEDIEYPSPTPPPTVAPPPLPPTEAPPPPPPPPEPPVIP